VFVSPSNPAAATVHVGKGTNGRCRLPPSGLRAKWLFRPARPERDEVLFRRIGGNELDAIEVCRGFVESAEGVPVSLDRHVTDSHRVHQYAQRIISTPGQTGRPLDWTKNADGTDGSGPISGWWGQSD
jgi:hypothetical protein